jgi:hypothetical protein
MRKYVLLLVCTLAAAACGGSEKAEPPVATPSLTLNHTRVPIGSPLKLTYAFQVADGASFDGDYVVFVHVLDPSNERLWTEDHDPEIPTSQWKPGQKIEYTRTIFVPNYPYIGEARVRMGLYKGERRLPLNAREVLRREYEVATFQLLPQSENIFLIHYDGFHPPEVAPDNPAVEWQWTKKTATWSFRNPKKDSTFYIEWDARVDLFTPPQEATVRVGEQTLGTFAADSKFKKLVTFPIAAAQFGPGDMAQIQLALDRTFQPGGGDTRELGLRVFNAFVDPR